MRIIRNPFMAHDSGDRVPIPLEIYELSACRGSVLSGSKNRKHVYIDLPNSAKWCRNELLSRLSTSGEPAGLCITVMALMNTFNKTLANVTIVDDLRT